MPNKGQFQKGPDPRRHVFTVEECSRGGQVSWKKYMVRHRQQQRLPVPRNLAQQYPEILTEGQDIPY